MSPMRTTRRAFRQPTGRPPAKRERRQRDLRLKDLTPRQAEVLRAAHAGELRRIHTDMPGADPWPAAPATLASLVRRELLKRGSRRNRKEQDMTTWTITQAGRDLIDPPVVQHVARPVLMSRVSSPPGQTDVAAGFTSGDYTNEREQAIDDLEVVDTEDLNHVPAQIRHMAARKWRRAA